MKIAFRKADMTDAELSIDVQSLEMNGNVKVARFVLER